MTRPRWTVRQVMTRWALPGLILVAGILAAGAAWWTVEDAERARVQAAFDSAANRITEIVRDDAKEAQDLLTVAQSFWTADPDAKPAMFSVFFGGLSGSSIGHAVRAVALLPRVSSDSDMNALMAAIADQRNERRGLGYPEGLTVKPETRQEERYPAVLVEPPAARPGVLGYDMFTDPHRRAAATRALRERRLVSSAPVLLTQDADETRSSVLVLAPLLVASDAEAWWIVAAKRDESGSVASFPAGFVAMGYSPSLGLEARTGGLLDQGLSVAVWDGGPLVGDEGRFVALDGAPPAHPPPARDPRRFFAAGPAFAGDVGAAAPGFDRVQAVPFAGRLWWVGVQGKEALRPLASRLMPPALGLAMLVGALALAALSHRLLRQQALLRAGVQERTQALTAANVALMDSRARAEAASAAKSQFMAAMNHELRTPLNAIIGFAQMIRDGIGMGADPARDMDTARTYSGHILTASESLLTQVNRVLDLSRIEAKGVTLSPEPLDLGALVDETLAMIRPIADDHAIALRLLADPSLPPVLADAPAVRQIVENLVSNALKFSPRKTEIVVSASLDRAARAIVLRVADQGSGIPAEHIAKVVEPFHQVADQWTRSHAGLGLGLSIVRDLTAGMGGHLSIDSEPGRGTTVSVTLPLALDDAAA